MSLHMLHLPIRPRALLACGRDHQLLDDTRSVELGYLMHALLARLWGEGAPKPFDVTEPWNARRLGTIGARVALDEQRLSVLAYAGDDLPAMAARARDTGDALALSAIDWDRAGGKPVPKLRAGQSAGFHVRVCPTVRIGKRHPRFGHGAEVDPYLALVERELAMREVAPPKVPARTLKAEVVAGLPAREAVYRGWLAARLGGAAHLDEARLVSMRDARLWRRGEPGAGSARVMHRHDRPRLGTRAMLGRREVVFEGTLQVCDAALFRMVLGRGLGRHRTFGFGMLLLRPAASNRC